MGEIFHIKRVLIENFRCIDRLDLEFYTSPGEGCVAVLAGDNGCGKTSVLEAIVRRIQSGNSPLRPALGDRDSMWGKDRFFIEIELNELSHEGFRVISMNHVHFRADRGGPLVRPEDIEKRLINVYSRSIRNGGLKETSPFVRLQNALRPFIGLEWTLDVLFEDERQDADPRLVFRNDALPDEVNSISQARKLSKSQKMPLVITLDQLSSGQLSLFSLMGPLVFASPDQPPLVLIDEPEQHMHPSWQRALLPALRQLSPLSQFIVATHSVDVLHSVASYERHLLLKDDDPRARDWHEPRQEAREP